MNERDRPEEVRDTLERVMREKGFLNNPVTLKTDIGDFTWYVDNDSPFAKNKRDNQSPQPVNGNQQQLTMPKKDEYYITMPHNLQKYDNDFANFISNAYGMVGNAYNDLKGEYFSPRNYHNRYRDGCTPSNIAYNTISNYQISPNQKLAENGNVLTNYAMRKFLSHIPVVGKYINAISVGENIGNGLTNLYNAIDEAECFK